MLTIIKRIRFAYRYCRRIPWFAYDEQDRVSTKYVTIWRLDWLQRLGMLNIISHDLRHDKARIWLPSSVHALLTGNWYVANECDDFCPCTPSATHCQCAAPAYCSCGVHGEPLMGDE